MERTLALLSTLGLAAVGLYFTSTDTAKAALGIAKATPEVRARIEGGTTVAWVALLVIALLPLLFGELALAPMRRAAHVEARRVRSAIAAALSIAFALVYVGLFTYAAGELDMKVDFSYFRTARPSDSIKKIAESSADPIKVVAFFPQLNEVGLEVDGYLRELKSAAPSLKVETYDRLLVPAVAKEAKVTQDGVLVLSRGNAKETLSIGAEMKTAASKLKTLDGDFQKALLKVLRDAHVAYFTVGHGELNEAGGAGRRRGPHREIDPPPLQIAELHGEGISASRRAPGPRCRRTRRSSPCSGPRRRCSPKRSPRSSATPTRAGTSCSRSIPSPRPISRRSRPSSGSPGTPGSWRRTRPTCAAASTTPTGRSSSPTASRRTPRSRR